jgi:hypothetical protein|tara:strand:+ start:298 stop:714 length:417 start_codon:yes stop_codon:yes gene_type:complete
MIEHELLQWIVSIVSIPLIGLFFSWRTSVRLQRTVRKIYPYSVLIIFMTWILTLYTKALTVGLFSTIESGQEKILESIAGYTIYQLWIYGGLGLIHGLLGGILLNLDLKKNLEKIKNGTQQNLRKHEEKRTESKHRTS